MAQLPKAPSSDAVGEVWHVVGEFIRKVSRRLEGTSDEGGLLQKIRPHQEEFKRAIRTTAPNFIPWESNKTHSHDRHLPQVEFLSNEEDKQLVPGTRKVYVDDVLHHAKKYVSLLLILEAELSIYVGLLRANFRITIRSLYKRSISLSSLRSGHHHRDFFSIKYMTF